MPPTIALLVWVVFILGLVFFDPAKDAATSAALWIPIIWMFIAGSRLPAQWLGGETTTVQAQAFEEGNPIDRTVFFLLIALAIGVLISRSFKWGDFFARNMPLIAFISFALVSVLWSDSPLVSFKRWFRDLGNYLVILVVLDPQPLVAVRATLRRLSYVLISLSILLIKYFPALGKQYSEWTGAGYFVGATTGKNMLGVICLISGIFFFWDTVTRWPSRKERRTKRIILVNIAFIGMSLWLLNLSNSATSRVCLAIGCLVIVAAHSGWARRNPGFLKALVPTCFLLYLILAYGFDINGDLAGAVGRDPTLTDRTAIWKAVLSMHTNPLVGTGYEGFWLGPRLQPIWRIFGPINESHNGYLEVYLNLGLIGVSLLVALLIASYRNICRQFTSSPTLASLNITLWAMMLFYNMTEAAFKAHLMWDVFLLAAIAITVPAEASVREFGRVEKARVAARTSGRPLEIAGQRR